LRFTILLLGFALIAPVAFSQDIDKYVSVQPAANWVNLQTISDVVDSNAELLDVTYQLVDRQSRMSEDSQDRYYRTRLTLNTASGVEDNSTIKINFDPEFRTVDIHEISITRAGKKSNRLIFSDLQIYRMETDRDRLLYNGTLQVALVISDVRVGDTLDYSYTISGQNPSLGKHFLTRRAQNFPVPVQRIYHQTRIEGPMTIVQKSQAGAELAKVSTSGNVRKYIWEAEGIKANAMDDDRPSWHYGRPTLEMSSFKDWKEVSRFFSSHYQLPKVRSAETLEISQKIMTNHSSSGAQARAALDFVQREIRYLGIELGAGGYQPRLPKTTLRRRFGDCKDMTLLLLELLAELKIEAVPLLVNSKERAGVIINVPSHGVFDHVIVMAQIDGKAYFFDPTTGIQSGNLDAFEQGQFGYGLPVSVVGSDMVVVKPKSAVWRKDFIDTFDLVSDPDTVLFSSEFNYFGSEADGIQKWLNRDGEKEVAKSFLDYFKDIFPSIEETAPMLVDFDQQAAHLQFKLSYKIPDAWEQDSNKKVKTFEAYPYELRADFPKFNGSTRSSPFVISHLERTRHRQKYIVDSDWDLQSTEESVENDSFLFSRSSAFSGNAFLDSYQYSTKTDFIAPEDFVSVMEKINEIRDGFGYNFTISTDQDRNDAKYDPVEDEFSEDEFTEEDIQSILYAVYFWLAFVTIFSLVVGGAVFIKNWMWRRRIARGK